MDRRKQMEDTDGEAPEDTTPNGPLPNARVSNARVPTAHLPNTTWTAPRGSADDEEEWGGEFEDGFEAHADADHAEPAEPLDPLSREAAPPRSGRPPSSNGISRSIPPAEPGLLSGWAERPVRRPDEESYEGEYEGEPDPEGGLLDSNQLDEWADSQGDTLLTKMDMDWDEEEAQTTLREGSMILPPPERESDASGEFGDAEFGDTDSDYGAAAQNLVPFRQSSLNAPSFSSFDSPIAGGMPVGSDMFSAFGQQVRPSRRKFWYVVAAAAGVALAFVVHALFGPTPTVTAIIVTNPADATVVVDGQALNDQTSPFTVQGLAADVEHSIEVRHEGFEPQTRSVRLLGSDTQTLPEFALKPTPVLTGFALESVPAGASVLVDKQRLPQSTPVRLTDLQPGPHVVRVELSGYQAWETQIEAVTGQVLVLPPAQLAIDAKAQRRLTWSERRAARLEAARAAAEQSTPAAGEATGDGADGEPAEANAETAPKRVRKTWSRSHNEPSSRHAAETGEPLADELSASDDPADPESLGAAEPAAVGASAEQGALSINSRPWSQVTIDGKLVGNTPQIGVQLSVGRHKVKLVNPELDMTRGFSVDIEAGKTTTKTVEFGE
jgi:eukaryotic-like serine/threonine-protein kinase